ncbi:MAG: KpsF/GutQ family sugar-phosphate isomerase [Fimbriimonadaceae bacterium]|nr:KpsF/GutQ family sugar-phosphate isomerase [Fimbriimonadaceae bacterium]QYK55845.1 MAG: KpsF/GutQ family sugar-phosphate isomerase [Fimbriimonadaceae bacterium]
MSAHVASGARVLRIESAALGALADRLGEDFDQIVGTILLCKGRIVCCGLGKSGHIAAKAAATFASTGTPALFLHAAEALHGDLGMVRAEDAMLAYSYSGETDEIVRVVQAARSQGATVIAVTGREASSAARSADYALDVRIDEEACPNKLAPTTSTTAMLAVSDALAVAVMEARGFGPADFARFHPSGALGRRLTLRVRDVMRTGDDLPLATPATPVVDLMGMITRAGAGGACVVDGGRLTGFVSDGDLRRHFLNSAEPLKGTAGEIMTKNPATIPADLLLVEAVEFFQNLPKKIGELPVLEGEGVVGLLMLKDIVRSGVL